jgi:hypothetical protein
MLFLEFASYVHILNTALLCPMSSSGERIRNRNKPQQCWRGLRLPPSETETKLRNVGVVSLLQPSEKKTLLLLCHVRRNVLHSDAMELGFFGLFSHWDTKSIPATSCSNVQLQQAMLCVDLLSLYEQDTPLILCSDGRDHMRALGSVQPNPNEQVATRCVWLRRDVEIAPALSGFQG